jgi:hypothetical protein
MLAPMLGLVMVLVRLLETIAKRLALAQAMVMMLIRKYKYEYKR